MKVLWQAWYGDREIDLDFPERWLVEKCRWPMRRLPTRLGWLKACGNR